MDPPDHFTSSFSTSVLSVPSVHDWETFPFKDIGIDDLDLDCFFGVVNLGSVVAGAAVLFGVVDLELLVAGEADLDNLNFRKVFLNNITSLALIYHITLDHRQIVNITFCQ